VLTHVSARYSAYTADLEQQAREVFRATTVARDGMEIDVPFVQEPGASQAPEPGAVPAPATRGT
jgi:hypothetical protein